MGKKKLFTLLISIVFVFIVGLTTSLALFLPSKTKADNIDQLENIVSGEVVEITKIGTAETASIAEKGGAIYVGAGTTYRMSGGVIRGKHSTFGGAVYVSAGGTFIMDGGLITDCEAYYGGAIYVEDGGFCYINAGTIKNCYAESGGAVYVSEQGLLEVDGDVLIEECENKKYESIINVYLDGQLTTIVTQKTKILKEENLPYSSEECCGYYLDLELTKEVNEHSKIANIINQKDRELKSVNVKGEELVVSLYTKGVTPGLSYVLNESGNSYSVKASETLSGEVVIAKEYNGKPVTQILDGGFKNQSLVSNVVMPSGISKIGLEAFSGCEALEKITISSNVNSIGNNSFSDCKQLVSVNIPKSVISMGYYVFSGCDNLTTITCEAEKKPSGWESDWRGGCSASIVGAEDEFDNGEKIINIYVDGVVRKQLTIIGDSYTITEADMPLQYEQCCGYFLNEELTKTTKGVVDLTRGRVNLYTKTASDLSNFLFNLNGVYYYVSASENIIGGDLVIPKEFDNKAVKLIDSNSADKAPFANCANITSITLPDGVDKLGGYTFYNCANLASINMLENITSIGNFAFYNCKVLTNINIPEKVTSIGNASFYACGAITNEIVLPSGLTRVGYQAFYNCSGITGGIEIPSGVTNIGNQTFYNCKNITSIKLHDGITQIGVSAFYNCSSLTGDIVIPKKVTSIENTAFYGCANLTGMSLHDNITKIGVSAFRGCANLSGEINIAPNLTTIGNQAFYGCKNITSIKLHEGIISIGASAFYNCSGLTGEIIVPSKITNIENQMFYGCKNLTGIKLHEGIISIGTQAFNGCSSLTSIFIPASVQTISATNYSTSPFNYCSSSLKLYCGATVKPEGWSSYWNVYSSAGRLEFVFGCNIDENGNIVDSENNILVENYDSVSINDLILETFNILAIANKEIDFNLKKKKVGYVLFNLVVL